MTSDDHTTTLRLQSDNKIRLTQSDPQAFSLSNGETFDPVMFADNRSFGGHDHAAGPPLPLVLAHEIGMVPRGHETNLLTVSFVRNAQTQGGRQRSNVSLPVRANGQDHATQSSRWDAKKNVGLVFVTIVTTKE